MHPVLLVLGGFSVSSFGFFLSLGFLTAVFVIWRLCQVYDIDEEKTLDLTFLAFFGGLLGARTFFVITHVDIFNDLLKVILIQRYPGLDFWGGLSFGFLFLKIGSVKLRQEFWQIADFIFVGLFAALVLGSFGCLLGSCQYGVSSNAFFAVPQEGLLGNRFPVQFLSSVLYFLAFIYLWKSALHFHFTGKISALGLIFLGLVKFFTDFFRGDRELISNSISTNQLLGLGCLFFGIYIIYVQGRRSPKSDLLSISVFFLDSKARRSTLSKFYRSWYNLVVNFKINSGRFRRRFIIHSKAILRNLNVKSNPPQF